MRRHTNNLCASAAHHERSNIPVGCLASVLALVACGSGPVFAPDVGRADDVYAVTDAGPQVDAYPATDGAGSQLYGECDPRANPCTGGLRCVDGLCQRLCSAQQSAPFGPCASPESWCDTSLGPIGLCRQTCDPALGEAANPACPVGTHCSVARDISTPAFCRLAAVPRQAGPRQLGEGCRVDFPLAARCDGGRGLYCHQGTVARCARACDPRLGESGNPDCEVGSICVEDIASFKQGRCAEPATRALGEWCEETIDCAAGLLCFEGLCRTKCDDSKGFEANPDCGSTPEAFRCFPDPKGGACLEACDQALGLVSNPDCPSRTLCRQGMCMSLEFGPLYGDVPRGGACSRSDATLFCESGSVCVEGTCVAECDPKAASMSAPANTSPACGANEHCVEAPWAPSGGYCAPGDATRTLHQTCGALVSRCGDGLSCANGICLPDCTAGPSECADDHACIRSTSIVDKVRTRTCRRRCDPDAPAHDSGCAEGMYCHSWSKTCTRSSQQWPGAKKAGDACSLQRSEDRCSAQLGLFCDVWGSPWGQAPSGRCLKGCDPTDGETQNPACPAGRECVATTSGPSPGTCLPPAAVNRGEACDSTSRCKQGLVCAAGRCEVRCDPAQGEAVNPACGGVPGSVCAVWEDNSLGSRYGAFCRTPCDSTVGELANPVCPPGMGCRASQASTDGTGFCEPTARATDGPRQPGEVCSIALQAGPAAAQVSAGSRGRCSLAKGLACFPGTYTCEKMCNPAAQESSCAPGRHCLGSWWSALGGYCL